MEMPVKTEADQYHRIFDANHNVQGTYFSIHSSSVISVFMLTLNGSCQIVKFSQI